MKCILVLPYFGTFKDYFELFLKSLAMNPDITLLLITDSAAEIEYPDNCIVKKMQFCEFRNRIQSKFDFDISLDSPYKLCDYKPAYGYICEDLISGYDYWGHCDCDLLFGDLSPVIELMEMGYDKLFVAGHLTIYKNTYENNRIFMNELTGVGAIYRQALGNPEIFAFDEVCYKVNVNSLFQTAGKRIYEYDLAYNSSTECCSLRRRTFDIGSRRWKAERSWNDQIYWDNGHVYRLRYNGLNRKLDEFIYIHLQMRKMRYTKEVLQSDIIRVEANGFQSVDSIPVSIFEYLRSVKIYFDINKLKKKYYKFKGCLKRERPIKWDCPWEYNPYQ